MSGAPAAGTFPGWDGAPLFWQRWPAAERRGVLVNVHGLGDHSGLYPHLVQFLPAHGWTVWALDTRGNGRSPGRRGHIGAWTEFRDDLDAFVRHVRAAEGDVPLVLLGNSLGGLMVIDYAVEHPSGLTGVAAAAPVLGDPGVPKALILLARLLTRVWPTYTQVTGLDLSNLARDPAIVRALIDDPLFHRAASARLGTETIDAIAALHARAARLAVPTLILHGAGDRMVPIDGSRRLATGPAREHVSLREYPEAGHALFVDWGYEERLADLLAWVEARAEHEGRSPG
jgi:alpha-beta hydrolase superfamily lysophospholipase